MDDYSDIMKTSAEIVENIQKTIQPVVQTSSELHEQMLKFNESVNRSFIPIRHTIEIIKMQNEQWFNFCKEISDLLNRIAPKYITEEQYKIYVSNARRFGMRCWGIHPDFPKNAVFLDNDQVELLIERCMQNVDQSFDSCFKAIKKEIEADYVFVIDEANICFKNQCYRACCSLLLSQIDRIFQSFLHDMCKIKGIYKEKNREGLDKKINEDYNVNEYDIKRLLLWISLKETFSIIYESVEFEHYCNNVDSEKINRHCLQHGYSLHKFSKRDCLQLSTILYSVINMTDGWNVIYTRSFSSMGMLVDKDDKLNKE